jgi:hypothetical protein
VVVVVANFDFDNDCNIVDVDNNYNNFDVVVVVAAAGDTIVQMLLVLAVTVVVVVEEANMNKDSNFDSNIVDVDVVRLNLLLGDYYSFL